IRRFFRRPSQPTAATGLHPTADGLGISPLKGSPSSLFMPWSQVTRAVAFKRDQYVMDRICIVFELSNARVLEINEDLQGWEGLVEQLPTHLPGALVYAEWFDEVAFPAFKTNEKTIFQRVVG
ncbi:MAG TPA: hypothetical protein VF219_11020, partial [Vicinamibacterales bacterium]